MKKRILHLPISEPWFSMIGSGTKKDEYRNVNEFYKSRLFDKEAICENTMKYIYETATGQIGHCAFANGTVLRKAMA